ncbi:MAG: hypothetical protein M1830_007539 [Pleopsidium flavum]|nr:MAG: hypothetical protein M1830_007539 [Pleopsidium flavum]
MCSYACPAGYQKSQWPSAQGVNGDSVGGISCSGGKLHLTNPHFEQLCIKGTGIVNVENKLGSNVAICRTDYPGTESETVPMDTSAGSTNPLTCPNGDHYYHRGNDPTSAQYYVNPAGVSVQNACRWNSGKDQGNKAPVNLGVSTQAGKTFLGLFQNHPTTNGTLEFDVEIVGDNLGGGKCRYHNGTYYDHNGGNIAGCTVEVMSGTATYVFTPWS